MASHGGEGSGSMMVRLREYEWKENFLWRWVAMEFVVRRLEVVLANTRERC